MDVNDAHSSSYNYAQNVNVENIREFLYVIIHLEKSPWFNFNIRFKNLFEIYFYHHRSVE